MTEVD